MAEYFIDSHQADADTPVIPLYICRPQTWLKLQAILSPSHQNFCTQYDFHGQVDKWLALPNAQGQIEAVLFGAGDLKTDRLGALRLGGLSRHINASHIYKVVESPSDWMPALMAIGWGMGHYHYHRYRCDGTSPPQLWVDETYNAKETQSLINAIHMGRDLINCPANDMGPQALGEAAQALAKRHKANYRLIEGEKLLEAFPLIHAIGRAADQSPRLVEFEWGNKNHPRLALIGKGITFDTGGLNIKPASGARLMKKDMGGAAHVLALADMIMSNKLPIRLHGLIAIAENAISSQSFRPGDVLTARSGLTIEIDNTDAEGRLVMADALTYASEHSPDLIIDFATLTGAARVALGPTLPATYSNRDTLIDSLRPHTQTQHDPIWPMPLWSPYKTYLNSDIADIANAASTPFAGSITAALFLERFVADKPWLHFDIYGWNPVNRPGHPKGGELFALRALYHWLKADGMRVAAKSQ